METQKTLRNWKNPIAAIIATLMTVVMMGACTTATTDGPIEASDNFMSALGNNNLEKAYNMTSSEFKEVADMEIFENFLGEFPVLTSYSSYTFDYDETSTTEDLSSEDAEIITLGITSGTIIDDEGVEGPLTINLVYRDDKWQIVNFSLETEDVPKEALYL